MDATTNHPAVPAEFATAPLTLDTISLDDLRELEDRARRAGDVDLLFHAQIAQTHLAEYHSGEEYYPCALEQCIAELNREQAVIDAAFAKAAETCTRLAADTHTERKDWRLALVGAR